MTSRRLANCKSLNENMKKPMIERRRAGLFKKAKELSVLCDLEIGIIIYNLNGSDPIVWPSRELVIQRFERFMRLPEHEKQRKLVTLERFLKDGVNDLIEKIRKKEKEIERKEMQLLMNEIVNGKSLKELDAVQVNGLYMLASNKMEELEKRKKVLLQQQNGSAPNHDHQKLQDRHLSNNAIGVPNHDLQKLQDCELLNAIGALNQDHRPLNTMGYYFTPQTSPPLIANDYNSINLQAASGINFQPSDGWNAGPRWNMESVVIAPPPPPPPMHAKQFIPPPTWMISTMLPHVSCGGPNENHYIQPNGVMTTSTAIAPPSNYGHQLPSFNPVWPFNFYSSS